MPFKRCLIAVHIVFKNYCVEMIQFQSYILDVSAQQSDEWCSLKGA